MKVPRRNLDPARFDKLDTELVDALRKCRDERGEIDDEKIMAALIGKKRSDVRLACEYIISHQISALQQRNSPNAEIVVSVARISQIDSISEVLRRYVKLYLPEAYEDYIHYAVNREIIQADERYLARRRAEEAKARSSQAKPPKAPRKKKK